MAKLFVRRLLQHRWTRGLLNPTHLATKLGFVVVIFGIISFILMIYVTSILIDNQFLIIEKNDINESIFRTKAKLENLKNNTEKKTKDWALWTDTFDYINNGNKKYLDTNLHASEAQAFGVEGIGYFRFDKKPRAIVYFNLQNGILVPDMITRLQAIGQSEPVIAAAKAKAHSAFFARTGNHLLAIAVAQVTRSDGSGTPAGFIMMANEVTSANLSEALQVAAKINNQADDQSESVFGPDKKILFNIGVPDITGSNIAVVSYSRDRAIMRAARDLQFVVMFGMALIIVFLMMTLTIFLNRAMIAPLSDLKRHVDAIGRTGDLVEISVDGRRDEIGSLAEGFNEMVLQLRDLQARMEAQSFQIGKTQSTIGSLHNVNNGLSPVKTLLSLLPQDLSFPAVNFVNQALAELAAGNGSFARRQQLVAFLSKAIDRVVEQLASAQLKVSEANRAIIQVVDTISAQQASARPVEDGSTCDLTGVVSSSLAIATYNNKGFPIVIDYVDKERHPVHGDRVLISQVIGNVLTNAVEAISAAGRSEGLIRIIGSTVTAGGRTFECVTIADNGDGFEPSMADDLFRQGFSTRHDKQGGLGLHWCANTINALGGSLTIDSAGPGSGATATIMLLSAAKQIEDPIGPFIEAAAEAA